MKYMIVIGLAGLSAASCPAAALDLTVQNPGFENSADSAPGWNISQHTGVPAYEISIDQEGAAEGAHSFRMRRTHEQVYGLIEQRITVPSDAAGRRLELKAMLKTRGVGQGGWVMVANFYTKSASIIRQMRAKPVTGDSEWQEVTLETLIPNQAHNVSVGVMLLDSGTGWLDRMRASIQE